MSRVEEITDTVQHDSFIANNARGIMFYGSERCPHCRAMKPVVERYSNKYPSVGFSHVETTKVQVMNVNDIPAFVAYKNGQPVDILLGADPEGLTMMIENRLLR